MGAHSVDPLDPYRIASAVFNDGWLGAILGAPDLWVKLRSRLRPIIYRLPVDNTHNPPPSRPFWPMLLQPNNERNILRGRPGRHARIRGHPERGGGMWPRPKYGFLPRTVVRGKLYAAMTVGSCSRSGPAPRWYGGERTPV